MDVLLLIARLLLAAVFLAAGSSKLANRAGTRQAMKDFGVPARLTSLASIALPVLELVISLGLFTSRWAPLAGGLALALLVLFVAGIAINLAQGRKPDCHCFGDLHSGPVGWSTIARNAFLAVLAGLVLVRGPGLASVSAVTWIAGLSLGVGLLLAALILVGALLAVEGWLLLNLLRQNGRILVRLDALEETLAHHGLAPASQLQSTGGLPVGSQAPDFRLPSLNGERLTLESLRTRGKPIMLVFSDPDCGPCQALLPEIATWQQEHEDRLTIALISQKKNDESEAPTKEDELGNVGWQEDREVAEAYGTAGTPQRLWSAPTEPSPALPPGARMP